MPSRQRNLAMRSLELRIPPPVVALAFGLLMWLAAQLVPSFAWPAPARIGGALALAGAGAALDIAALVAFLRAHTTVNPLRPGAASSLVVTGIYRRSRNPMYVGAALLLVAWATFLANAAAYLLVPVFVLYLTRFQIIPEERLLADIFGPRYRSYRETVRRWL
jgi:protein-S-isoprenylcysteine O-methyltransferase Ste14